VPNDLQIEPVAALDHELPAEPHAKRLGDGKSQDKVVVVRGQDIGDVVDRRAQPDLVDVAVLQAAQRHAGIDVWRAGAFGHVDEVGNALELHGRNVAREIVDGSQHAAQRIGLERVGDHAVVVGVDLELVELLAIGGEHLALRPDRGVHLAQRKEAVLPGGQ
jgi:hypothetical protein